MASPISFTCPYPPTSNTMFRGRRFITESYRQWRWDAGWAIKLQKPGDSPSGDIKIQIELPRSMRRGDIDNRIKALLDVMTDIGLIEDDRVFSDLRIRYVDRNETFVTIESDQNEERNGNK